MDRKDFQIFIGKINIKEPEFSFDMPNSIVRSKASNYSHWSIWPGIVALLLFSRSNSASVITSTSA